MLADGTNPWKDLALVVFFFLPICAGVFGGSLIIEGIVLGEKKPKHSKHARVVFLRCLRWFMAGVFGIALVATVFRLVWHYWMQG